LAVALQWPNKHLLLPLINDKWKAPEMLPHLKPLVKHVAELYKAGLEACHYTEEFILRWIHLVG
jgi:hypothetical protein